MRSPAQRPSLIEASDILLAKDESAAGVPRPATPDWTRSVTLGDLLGLIILSGVLAIFAVNRFAPPFLDADTFLFSLISLQHLTLFFWGQNRFVDVFPWLVSWITDPQANLLVQLFLFAFGFFAFSCTIGLAGCRLMFPSASRRDRWTTTLLLLAVTLACLQSYAAQVFITEGQPYATSYLLTIVGATLLCGRLTVIRVTAATGCVVLAAGLNPGVLLVAIVLSGFVLSAMGYRRAALVVLVTFAGVELWAFLGRWAPAHPVAYAGIIFGQVNTKTAASVANIALALRLTIVAGLCGLLAMLSCLSLPRLTSPRQQPVIVTLAVFALIWTVGFSANSWVQNGDNAFRYFFPTLMIIPVIITAYLATYILASNRRVRDGCLAGSVAFLAVYLIRPPVALHDYRIVGRVTPFVDYARSHKVKFIGGYYWLAWPTVFLLQDQPNTVFGLAYRANGNLSNLRHAVDADLTANGRAVALCLGSEAFRAECVKEAEFYSGRPWHTTAEICPDTCSVIETRPAAADP